MHKPDAALLLMPKCRLPRVKALPTEGSGQIKGT
jgi:hypothetical protein